MKPDNFLHNASLTGDELQSTSNHPKGGALVPISKNPLPTPKSNKKQVPFGFY